jgi:hypothetical protein
MDEDPATTARLARRRAGLAQATLLWALLLAGLALRPEPWHLGGSSVISHLLGFALLTLLLTSTVHPPWMPTGRRPGVVLALLGILMVFGVALEAAQGLLTDERSARLRDVYANTAGIAVGFLVWVTLERLMPRRTPR